MGRYTRSMREIRCISTPQYLITCNLSSTQLRQKHLTAHVISDPWSRMYTALYFMEASSAIQMIRRARRGNSGYYTRPSRWLSSQNRSAHSSSPKLFKTNELCIAQAGGIATTGTQRILDIVPTDIHERCPVFLGSRDDVNDLLKFYKEVPKGSS